jgi:hypothetical protein
MVSSLAADGAPTGEAGKALEAAFPRLADDLMWRVEQQRCSDDVRSRRIDRLTPPAE